MKHIRYLDASHNHVTDPRPIATSMPSLLAANVAHNSLVTLADFSGCPHLQVLNAAHNRLVSLEPREPPPPPPSLHQLERLRRAARKEARAAAKAAAKAAASKRSRRSKSREAGEEDEDEEPAITEESILQRLLTEAAEEAAVTAREEAGDVGAALLERTAAPGLLHLILNGNPLVSFEGLAEGGLPKLLRLEASACAPLRSLSTLGSMPSLREVIITDCPDLTDISGLHQLPSLRVLVLDRCGISSLKPLLTGEALPQPVEGEEEGEEEGEGDDAASEEAGPVDPEGEDGGDGVHHGRWEDDASGKWLPAEAYDIVEAQGLESDDEDERVAGADQDEEDEDEAGEGKEASESKAQGSRGPKAPQGPPRATTARGIHPLGNLRVLSLAGNPIESLAEVNRLRYLRGLASVNFTDTPVSDAAGEEDFTTEVLVRLGGKLGQRIRLAAQLSRDRRQAASLSVPSKAAREAGEDDASLEAAAAANVIARVNGADVTADAIVAARAERVERVGAWMSEWERRKEERLEALAARRAAEEEEEEEEDA